MPPKAPLLALTIERETLQQKLNRDFADFEKARAARDLETMELVFQTINDRRNRLEATYKEMRGLVRAEDVEQLVQTMETIFDAFSAIKGELRRLRGDRVPATTPTEESRRELAVPEGMLTMNQVMEVIRATQREREPAVKITVKPFGGEPEKWKEFWTAFEVAVHGRSISNTEKHVKLFEVLEGDARNAVRYLNQTGDTYELAIQILKKKYEQAELVEYSKLMTIMSMQRVVRADDYKALRKLFDQVNCIAHTLVKPEDNSDLHRHLIQMILSKLPMEFQTKWCGKIQKHPRLRLKDLLDYLDAFIQKYEHAAQLSRLEKGLAKLEVTDNSRKIVTINNAMTELAAAGQAAPAKKKDKKSIVKKKKYLCRFCDGEHSVMACTVPYREKMERIVRENRCLRCLRDNHETKDCRVERRCEQCQQEHHTALCARYKPAAKVQSQASGQAMAATATWYEPSTTLRRKILSKIYTKTATVLIETASGWKEAMCMLDDGANISLIKKEFAVENGLPASGLIDLSLQVVGHAHPVEKTVVRRVKVKGCHSGAPEVEIEAVERTSIATVGALEHTAFAQELHDQGYPLADRRFLTKKQKPCEIQLLVGARDIWEFCKTGQIISQCGVRALESNLGWLLLGQDKAADGDATTASVLLVRAEPLHEEEKPAQVEMKNAEETGEAALKLFWTLEHFGALDEEPTEEEELEELLKLVRRGPEGRFVTALPWNASRDQMKDNYNAAWAQLKSLMKRLERDPELKKEYFDAIQKLKEAGFVGVADPNFNGLKTHLPHHPVIRKDKATTKVRPVFNGSFGKPSLNDCVESGPNLNPDLFDVMLRYRVEKIVWMADIEHAFLTIELEPQDAQALRFLWVAGGNDEDVEVLHWKRLPFGLRCSPFLLRAVFKLLLEEWKDEFPELVDLLLKQLYVDDFMGYAATLAKAIIAILTSIVIFKSAGMTLRKWITNDPELRKFLEGLGIGGGTTGMITITVDGVAKALGTGWDTATDCFFFDVQKIVEAAGQEVKPTKRSISSISSRIYDVLGSISPATLQLKLIYQQLSQLKIGWDSPVPEKIANEWRRKMEDMSALQQLRIPRTANFYNPEGARKKWELHVFSDASQNAYGAVAYARESTQDESVVLQLCSKTRVCPSGSGDLTLARKELLGMLLGSKLGERAALAIEQVQWTVYLWTDSMIAMGWVSSRPERWKPFVRNRVETIQKRFSPNRWNHVPGAENPADLASRGLKASELVESRLWWTGPHWLKEPKKNWPQLRELTNEEAKAIEAEERPKAVLAALATGEKPHNAILELVKRVSKYSRMTRAVAWARRFVNNSLKRTVELGVAREMVFGKEISCLTTSEVKEAETILLRAVQMDAFPDTYVALKSKEKIRNVDASLKPLKPMWDKQRELVVVKGRVGPALEELGVKPPVLLPYKHRFTEVFVDSTHRGNYHMGVQTTWRHVREKFWIIKGRQQVKRTLKRCVPCQKVNTRAFDQTPAELPLERTKRAYPFEIIGVDFAGPVKYIEGDIAKNEYAELNAYITLFTCAVTRAVHLEVTMDLSTPTFINAFRRMMARRGSTATVYSDNGGAFEGTVNVLEKLKEDAQLQNWLTTKEIDWRFSASLAPWWGGFWERMVKTVKELLTKGLGKAKLTWDQLATATTEVEGIVNSRPLTYVPASQDEPYVLSPAQLICGRQPNQNSKAEIPPERTSSHSALVEWDRERARITSAWWRAWTVEYLQDLKRFHCEGRELKAPKLGQACLVRDDNKKRDFWNLGIINSLQKGRDGRVRAVQLKMATGNIVKRDIRALYPLEVDPDEPEAERFHERATPVQAMQIRPVQRPPITTEPDARSVPETTTGPAEGAPPKRRRGRPRKPKSQGDSPAREIVVTRAAEPQQVQEMTRRGRPIRLPTRLRDGEKGRGE